MFKMLTKVCESLLPVLIYEANYAQAMHLDDKFSITFPLLLNEYILIHNVTSIHAGSQFLEFAISPFNHEVSSWIA